MRAFLPIVVVLLGAVAPGQADEHNPSLELENILAASEQGCQSIESFELDVTVITTNLLDNRFKDGELVELLEFPMPWVRTSMSRQFYQSGDYRMDVLRYYDEPVEPGAYLTVWHEATERIYSQKTRFGRLRAYGHTMIGSIAHVNYLSLYQSFDGNFMSYAEFIRSRLPDHVELRRENKLFVITALPDPSRRIHANKTGVRLFLDPNKNSLPVRIEMLSQATGGELRVSQIRENQLREVMPGAWAPVQCDVTSFVMHEDEVHRPFLGKPSGRRLVTIDERTARFNERVDPRVFEFDFPDGTKVRDEVRNTVFIVGADDPHQHLASLAQQGKLGAEELAKVPPRVTRSQVAAARSWRPLFWTISAVCLTILGLIAARRILGRPRAAHHR